ncbi:hypothetical protein [Mycobacterium sp. TY815]|uniref:hypothetical protein n=1 Tax=Mycobacterium sp. TY815 TaxID=3050581 RepID=UPI002741D759|nr:hypothetical protein [Mycobacterium sp. TY815]MDP7707396.1 hypothetical protein [Mycobacterium sp. TY815]
MKGSAQRASETLGMMLEAIYQWEARVDAFMMTGDDESDIAVTHDGRGRLIEMSIRPGLQEELTVEELEDAVNAEIARNARRAYEELMSISKGFLAQWSSIPQELASHPVAAQFSQALSNAQSSSPPDFGRLKS